MDFAEELEHLDNAQMKRQLRFLDSGQGSVVRRDGGDYLNFSSNDYLGLSQNLLLQKTAIEAVRKYGVGAGSSRLVCGSLPPHAQLEDNLANLKGVEAALTFSSGFNAALAVLPSLLTSDDFVVVDKLAHACLIDGVRLSGATLRVFPHNDLEKLESHLKWCESKRKYAVKSRVLIIVESVYSMDGDLAPLADIVALKNQYNGELLVDEAHGVGVLGENGMGLIEHLNLSSQVEYQMGTFSKAFGVSGGYLACSSKVKEWLVNKGRAFIYSTAPPPAIVETVSASLEIIASSQGEALRVKLFENIKQLARLLGVAKAFTPIMPVVFDDNEKVLRASSFLEKEGILVPAIRYPTVPKSSPRLRVSLSASHSSEQISKLAQNLKTLR